MQVQSRVVETPMGGGFGSRKRSVKLQPTGGGGGGGGGGGSGSGGGRGKGKGNDLLLAAAGKPGGGILGPETRLFQVGRSVERGGALGRGRLRGAWRRHFGPRDEAVSGGEVR